MLIWSQPELLGILKRRKIPCYVDGTFRSVPRPFKQCVILMAYDDECELYVPVIFSLMQNTNQWSYWHLFHLIIVLTDTKLDPSTITSDFEVPLMNAIREQFPNSELIGCLFHFKQAIFRKLKKIGMDDDEISKAMKTGGFDKVTTVRRSELKETLQELRATMNEKDPRKWGEFYKYFEKTWLNKYDFNSWNISETLDKNIDIQNRTNNALESFNRQLNSNFPSPHPNIFNFIEIIKEISNNFVRRIKGIKGR